MYTAFNSGKTEQFELPGGTMSKDKSALSLPRSVAGGLITIIEPGHAKFGDIDVYLTPNGGATILGDPEWEAPKTERPQLIPQDAWAGLNDFINAAQWTATRNFWVTLVIDSYIGNCVSVGVGTLAHLYAQRVLTQVDLIADNILSRGRSAWEIILMPRHGYDRYMVIRFSAQWKTVHVGLRDENESDTTFS